MLDFSAGQGVLLSWRVLSLSGAYMERTRVQVQSDISDAENHRSAIDLPYVYTYLALKVEKIFPYRKL